MVRETELLKEFRDQMIKGFFSKAIDCIKKVAPPSSLPPCPQNQVEPSNQLHCKALSLYGQYVVFSAVWKLLPSSALEPARSTSKSQL